MVVHWVEIFDVGAYRFRSLTTMNKDAEIVRPKIRISLFFVNSKD